MYSEYGKRVNDIRRRMVRNTRIACFAIASTVHLSASGMLLALQTSCAYPRCVGGVGFEMFRAVMQVPLFVTPWLGLPSPDLDYVRDEKLFPLLLLNAGLAVALYWGAATVARRVYGAWQARRYATMRAARRAR